MPGRERCFVRDALPILFAGAMSMAGHHGIHAACLSLGLANDSPSVLLMGPSGSGKTTTAMAMMRGGLCHLADDVTFVVDQPGDGSPRIWGWRTPCKICPDSLLLLPWLAENPAVSGSSTTPTAIPAPGVAGVSRLLVRPRLLLFLSDRSMGDHVLEPIDNLTAVQSLIKENLRTRHPELRDVAGAGFRILTRLVASCRSFKLHAGPRLETLVAHVGPMLREVDT